MTDDQFLNLLRTRIHDLASVIERWRAGDVAAMAEVSVFADTLEKLEHAHAVLSGTLNEIRDHHFEPNYTDPSSPLHTETKPTHDPSLVRFSKFDEKYAVLTIGRNGHPSIEIYALERPNVGAAEQTGIPLAATEATGAAQAILEDALSKNWDLKTAATLAAERSGAWMIVLPSYDDLKSWQPA